MSAGLRLCGYNYMQTLNNNHLIYIYQLLTTLRWLYSKFNFLFLPIDLIIKIKSWGHSSEVSCFINDFPILIKLQKIKLTNSSKYRVLYHSLLPYYPLSSLLHREKTLNILVNI